MRRRSTAASAATLSRPFFSSFLLLPLPRDICLPFPRVPLLAASNIRVFVASPHSFCRPPIRHETIFRSVTVA